jgi:hypothetical protein
MFAGFFFVFFKDFLEYILEDFFRFILFESIKCLIHERGEERERVVKCTVLKKKP